MISTQQQTSRERVLGNAVLLSGSGIIGYAFQFVTGLVNPRVLGPENYGAWQIVGLITGYAAYSHLGIAQALRRELPMLLGRSDEVRAAHMRDVGYSTSMLFSAVFAVLICLAYLIGLRFRGVLTLPLLILVVINILVARYGTAYSNVLSGYGKFSSLGYFDVLMPALFMMLSIPLVILYKVPGLVIANTASQLMAFLMIRAQAKIPIVLKFDWRASWHLLRVGLPILLLVFMQRIFQAMELTLVAFFFSLTNVGLYGFALGMIALADMIPSSFNKLFMRDMAKEYGRAGSASYDCFKRYMQIPCVSYIFISVIVGQCFFFAFGFLVRTIYPTYLPSVSIMMWLIMGYVFFNMRVFSGLFLTIVRLNTAYFLVLLISVLVNLTLDILLLINGYGLISIAAASSLSYLVFGGLMLIICHKYIYGSSIIGVKYFARFIIALIPSFVCLYSLGNTVLIQNVGAGTIQRIALDGADTVLKASLVILVNCMIFALVFRRMHFWSELNRNLGTVFNLGKKQLFRHQIQVANS